MDRMSYKEFLNIEIDVENCIKFQDIEFMCMPLICLEIWSQYDTFSGYISDILENQISVMIQIRNKIVYYINHTEWSFNHK